MVSSGWPSAWRITATRKSCVRTRMDSRRSIRAGFSRAAGPGLSHKTAKRVYMETNKGDDVNLAGLVLFDPETAKIEPVESDPLKRVDFGSAMFSEATDDLTMTTYLDDRPRRYFKDKTVETDLNALNEKLPVKEIGIASRS